MQKKFHFHKQVLESKNNAIAHLILFYAYGVRENEFWHLAKFILGTGTNCPFPNVSLAD